MPRQIIDLSKTVSNNTDGVTVTLQDNLPVYLNQPCYAYDLSIKSHTGTYFETSAHLFRDGKTTDQWPLEKLILPGICIRIKKEDKCITAQDLQNACPDIAPDVALLIDTGKSLDKYFSRDAAVWMAEKKSRSYGKQPATLRYRLCKPHRLLYRSVRSKHPHRRKYCQPG